MDYTNAASPEWANAAQSTLNLMVVFPHIGDEPVPFTATADDVMDYGRELFARAVAGDFGPIAAFVPPPVDPDAADKARIAELKRLLAASDYKVLPDYDKPDAGIREQRQAWREEVRALEAANENI